MNNEDLNAFLSFGEKFTNVPGGTAAWSFSGGTNYNPQNGTAAIVISKADATVTVSDYTGIYDGDATGLTWTGEFDVWARFASDYNAFAIGSWNAHTADVEIQEVRRRIA